MDPVVFTEKVRRPDPRGLDRPRLEERLLGPDAPPLGLVLGPPGSGKTTLLARVAASAPGPAAWYRAEADDADEAALARHLAGRSARSSRPRTGPTATLRRPTSPVWWPRCRPGRSRWSSSSTTCTRSPAPPPSGRWNAWSSTGPGTSGSCSAAAARPRSTRAGCWSPGDLVQLDAEDLRFRSWEVEELFRERLPRAAVAGGGGRADPPHRRLGGRAAAVPPGHGRAQPDRAGAGRRRAQRAVPADPLLPGPQRAGRAAAEQRRRFLLRTCTLGVLTGDAVRRAAGAPPAARPCSTSSSSSSFFTTSTDDGRTFRYHQVLQTHLEVVLVDELGAAGRPRAVRPQRRLLERSGRHRRGGPGLRAGRPVGVGRPAARRAAPAACPATTRRSGRRSGCPAARSTTPACWWPTPAGCSATVWCPRPSPPSVRPRA